MTWRRRPTTRWGHKYLGISTQYLHNIYSISTQYLHYLQDLPDLDTFDADWEEGGWAAKPGVDPSSEPACYPASGPVSGAGAELGAGAGAGIIYNKSATFPRQSQRSAEPGGGGEQDPQQLFYPGIMLG